jgi:hypothetical protein
LSAVAFHLTQTSVAILAISSLIVLSVLVIQFSRILLRRFRVTIHNRREAEFLSQTEQEMILIGGIALFWIGEFPSSLGDCSKLIASVQRPWSLGEASGAKVLQAPRTESQMQLQGVGRAATRTSGHADPTTCIVWWRSTATGRYRRVISLVLTVDPSLNESQIGLDGDKNKQS